MTSESWLGEFFSESPRVEGIPGLIHYSRAQGVTLRFLKRISSQWIQPSVLHGILETGEECTLLGPVLLPGMTPESYHQHYNGQTVVSGKVGYQFLVIGKHLDLSESIGEASFSFSGIGAFATGLDSFLQTHEDPLVYSDKSSFGKISIWRQDSGVPMLSIKEAVYAMNKDCAALESLSSAYDAIEKEHDAHFLMRTSAQYRVILEFDSKVSLNEACLLIQGLVGLFSLLVYAPVLAESVIASGGSLDDRRLLIYKCHAIDERTLDIIDSRRSVRENPINLSAIAFADVVEAWSSESAKYSPLLSGIQSRTGVKAVHEVYAEIILYCAFMESIAHEAGLAKKYEDCLQNYACNGLQDKILGVFGLPNIVSAGVAISELRADIVHFKGARKWIDRMPTTILCQLSQYLELTVIGYLLGRLGIDRELIQDYQILHSATLWTGI